MKKPILSSLIFAALSINIGFAEPVTLTIASFPSFDEAVIKAIPRYKELHPDVTIKLTSRAWADHHTSITTTLATNSNIPDIIGIESTYMGRLANSKGIADLRKEPYNSQNIENLLTPFALAMAVGKNNKLAALPVDIGPGAMFYREDLLKSSGVTIDDISGDWDKFVEAGIKIKQNSDSYMVSNATFIKDLIIRSDLKPGEGIYFDQDDNILVQSPRFKEAFRVAKAVRDAKIDAKVSIWSSEWTEGLKSGKIAVEFMGSWLGGQLEDWIAPESSGQWRTAQLPNDHYATWGGSFYALSSTTKYPEQAWDFLKFMALNVETQQQAFEKIGAFPALLPAQQGAFFEENIAYLGGQKARLQWLDASKKIPAISVHRHDPVASQIIDDALEKVLEKDLDIDKALADAAKAIKRKARH